MIIIKIKISILHIIIFLLQNNNIFYIHALKYSRNIKIYNTNNSILILTNNNIYGAWVYPCTGSDPELRDFNHQSN